MYYELNLDGLVGPTHHYGGLSSGNIASTSNALNIANPAAAALQGIEKMRFLHHLGLKQAFIPHQLRPNLELLHALGFSGQLTKMLNKARKEAPELLSACYSSSNMWAANAATVTPSLDSSNRKLHITPANLINNLHRHQEASTTQNLLKKIFPDPELFEHHSPLPATNNLSDEGAANHSRLSKQYGTTGFHLFIYNKAAFSPVPLPKRYPARQSLEASESIARNHQLTSSRVVFAQQNPKVVDQGVFHNDVIAVANESLLLLHQSAFVDQAKILDELKEKADFEIKIVELSDKELTVQEAVSSYLFNSQLVTRPDGVMALIAPFECQEQHRVKACIDNIIASPDNPIGEVYFQDVKQSMKNGGGPACLRLRVVLNDAELVAMHQGVIVTDSLLHALADWVKTHYRTHLTLDDLADPLLIDESQQAFEALLDLVGMR